MARSAPICVQAVLLCNAVPVVVQLLWNRSSKDFASACTLLQVLLARMPRMEQQALLQELLSTGAILRLLMVMSQVLPLAWGGCTLARQHVTWSGCRAGVVQDILHVLTSCMHA